MPYKKPHERRAKGVSMETTIDSAQPADSAFVLEGQQDAGTVSGDLAVLDLHAYFDHFGNAQVTQGFGGGSTPDSALGDRAPYSR